jgi:type IV pilus assembly protein PilB
MQLTKDKLKFLLVEPDLISLSDFKVALAEAEKKNVAIDEVLVANGVITDSELGQLVAGDLGLRFLDLKTEKYDNEIFSKVPELMAKTQGVVATSRLKNGVKVGMLDPTKEEIIDLLEKRFGESIITYMVTNQGLNYALGRYKSDIVTAMQTILKDGAKGASDQSVVKIVDMLFQYAYDNHASDIHIEPYRKKIAVRFRIDGVMHDVLDINKNFGDAILSRIKVLGKMRTDEHRAAQDGKLRFSADADLHADRERGSTHGSGEAVDVRISIVPTNIGENVVMRLLSSKNRQFGLSDIGLGAKDIQKVKASINHPHGMILVTGPTGSGKSTTLYSMLKILNKREVHIATIEDPVEYDVEGVSQIQVNTKTKLTFAKGLRALVRQDPDIIMVGEIRDEETAGIAVNSALTGHLVLSTLHTNDAPTTLPRLLDMNVEPFLVSSTVNIIIAQRLVRKICSTCRASSSFSDKEKTLIKTDARLKSLFLGKSKKKLESITIYKGSGCKACSDTGYSGRIGVFEILEMTDEIREMVMKNVNADNLRDMAIGQGMSTMMEDGVRKVLEGVTTIEEVLRVARD